MCIGKTPDQTVTQAADKFDALLDIYLGTDDGDDSVDDDDDEDTTAYKIWLDTEEHDVKRYEDDA